MHVCGSSTRLFFTSLCLCKEPIEEPGYEATTGEPWPQTQIASFFQDTIFCILPHVNWKLWGIYERSTYWTTVVLSKSYSHLVLHVKLDRWAMVQDMHCSKAMDIFQLYYIPNDYPTNEDAPFCVGSSKASYKLQAMVPYTCTSLCSWYTFVAA